MPINKTANAPLTKAIPRFIQMHMPWMHQVSKVAMLESSCLTKATCL
ncbi:hypothetical protein BSPLISOX_3309 [uncultured Gammaproteobacteria bacterium]|nr:hypothetical protein [uncultured Gammaproteobacteria bacterium]CAC9471748.1 hypothetical protein [uncultured Gammaproteobacteria bacterium]VVH67178.1 hypothetical protein BSPLISOX_3309 [uncultured Gammaproteobacteria bacterium]